MSEPFLLLLMLQLPGRGSTLVAKNARPLLLALIEPCAPCVLLPVVPLAAPAGASDCGREDVSVVLPEPVERLDAVVSEAVVLPV